MSSFLRKLPFLSGLFHSAPPYHTGSVWENKTGFQVARLLAKDLQIKMRSFPKPKIDPVYLKEMKDNGIIKLEDFLSPEDFGHVKSEYERFKKTMELKPYKPSGNVSMMVATCSLNEQPELFKETIRIFSHNAVLEGIASSVIRQDLSKYQPVLSYLILDKNDNDTVDDDYENILHADVHYPTVKGFFYLGNFTKDNGAYIYAKGSHKLTKARIAFEHNMSVRVAKLRRGDKDIAPKYLEIRGARQRNIVSEGQRKEMGIVETQFTGAPNTLVISNNIGFHRRGEFKPGQRRELLLINFRQAEAGWIRKLINK